MENSEHEYVELSPAEIEPIGQIPQRMEEPMYIIAEEAIKSSSDEEEEDTKSHRLVHFDQEPERKLFEEANSNSFLAEHEARWLEQVHNKNLSFYDESNNDTVETRTATLKKSVSFHLAQEVQNVKIDLNNQSSSVVVLPGSDDVVQPKTNGTTSPTNQFFPKSQNSNGAPNSMEQERPRNNRQMVRLITMPVDDDLNKTNSNDQQTFKWFQNLKWWKSLQRRRQSNLGKNESLPGLSKDEILRYRIRRRNNRYAGDNDDYFMMKTSNCTNTCEGCDDGPSDGFVASLLHRCFISLLSLGTLNEHFEKLIGRVLHRTFRAPFWKIWMYFLVAYLILITVFAILAFGSSRHQPKCFVYGYHTIAEGEKIPFLDSWQLSWTTIATVGYGAVSPGLAGTTSNGSRCIGINVLMALESFVGVLFGGITGALIFAKVARVQAFASVQFSLPITVVFGSGLNTETDKGLGSTRNLAGSTRNQMGSTRNLMGSKDLDRPPIVSPSTRDVSDSFFEPDDQFPCPILEFRVLNTSWRQPGGEIMDAAVKLVVSRLDASERGMAGKRKKKRKKAHSTLSTLLNTKTMMKAANAFKSSLQQSQATEKVWERKGTHAPTSKPPTQFSPVSAWGANSAHRLSGNFLQNLNWSIIGSAAPVQQRPDLLTDPFNSKDRAQIEKEKNEESIRSDHVATVDEGEDAMLAPKQIFYNLPVETDQYPCFKRIWNIRHVCNEDSPLLPKRIRRWIKTNNGFWPKELCRADAVRKAINFHEIIVSISGTCNATGASVYSQKVYQYVDMTVGYTFANMLYQDDRDGGNIRVDGTLLNDVTEQSGGGAEPIDCKDKPNFHGY